MALTMHDACIPVLQQMLKSLSSLLEKAEAHAVEKGLDVAVLLNASLAPDMFNFTRQVQIATDHAKGAAARLAGVEIPRYEDSESTVAELQARIFKTLEFISSLRPEQFEGAESRSIEMVFPWATYNFSGQRYLSYWVLPNFFFHVTTAYNILRSRGVQLGKVDFLGPQ